MTKEDEREVQRKLRILQHAEKIGHVAKACRYFGIARASFYRWKRAYERDGEAGLVNAKTIPKNPPNQTPPEVPEKVLHLRCKYHLGPERIMWYLARYHGIKLSGATIYRILKSNGQNRLPRGTRLRKVHTKRYNKQVPGHHIQMDVKFLTFIGKKGEKIRRFQYTAIDDATRVRALDSNWVDSRLTAFSAPRRDTDKQMLAGSQITIGPSREFKLSHRDGAMKIKWRYRVI
jgi:transposase-like protein